MTAWQDETLWTSPRLRRAGAAWAYPVCPWGQATASSKAPMQCLRLLGLGTLALSGNAALAQSSVHLYGLLDMQIYRKQLANESHTLGLDSGGLNASFWGVRGREDLGRGLRAEFDITGFFRTTTGATGRSDFDPFFSRSSWLGLNGAWGGARAGRQSSLSFLNLMRYNPFSVSSTYNPTFLHNYQVSVTQPIMTSNGGADSIWDHMLSYSTPNWGGFTGAVSYAPAHNTAAGRRMGASLSYTQGAFSTGLVAEKLSGMELNFSKPPINLPMNDSRLWNWGASYDFKSLKLFGQILKTELRNATTRIDVETHSIGTTVTMGSGKLLLSYAQSSLSQTAQANWKRRTTALAYEYGLSKRTDLYSVLMNDRVTRMTSGNGLGAGIRHRF